jgi:hypothetical protein
VACLLGRRVIISGGTIEDDQFIKEFAAYDVMLNTWKPVHTSLKGWRGKLGHTMTPCYRHKVIDLYAKPSKGAITDGNKVRNLEF